MNHWNLLVKNCHGEQILIVEIKRQINVSQEWVIQLYDNLFSMTVFPESAYFLIAFPDKFYLWLNKRQRSHHPDFIINPYPYSNHTLKKQKFSPIKSVR